jgi:hypothetical protein
VGSGRFIGGTRSSRSPVVPQLPHPPVHVGLDRAHRRPRTSATSRRAGPRRGAAPPPPDRAGQGGQQPGQQLPLWRRSAHRGRLGGGRGGHARAGRRRPPATGRRGPAAQPVAGQVEGDPGQPGPQPHGRHPLGDSRPGRGRPLEGVLGHLSASARSPTTRRPGRRPAARGRGRAPRRSVQVAGQPVRQLGLDVHHRLQHGTRPGFHPAVGGAARRAIPTGTSSTTRLARNAVTCPGPS